MYIAGWKTETKARKAGMLLIENQYHTNSWRDVIEKGPKKLFVVLIIKVPQVGFEPTT